MNIILNMSKADPQNTEWRPVFLSYRNQSINLLSKSIDWFPYDRNIQRRSVVYTVHIEHVQRNIWCINPF